MPWEIKEISVTPGNGKWTRIRVHGRNTDASPPEDFRWQVSSVADSRYIAHESASAETRAVIAAEKSGARGEEIQALARAFSRQIHATLTKEELAECIERNRHDEPNICHTHDHHDANMIMEAAFVARFGREPQIAGAEDTPDLLLWNAAWLFARASEFNANVGLEES